MRSHARIAAPLALAWILPATAHADGWFVAEAPAALAVSDVHESVFRPGLMPAVGIYADNDHLALGLRLRAGIMRNGPAPGNNLDDPGIGGLTTAGVAFRFLLGRGWAEAVLGGGLTGHDLVPAFEAGVGWAMPVGKLDIGPSIRYVRVVSRDTMSAFGTAELAIVGVDVRFGKARPRRLIVAPPRPVAVVAAVERVPEYVEPDRDRVVDHETSCREQLDGCPLSETIVIRDDRIVLSERVLFDFNRARVRSRGRELIAEILRIWKTHPDWKRVTIEGHTDVRGTDDYNLDLSQRRADHVRDVFVKLGIDGAQIDAVGFGRSRVRDPGESEEAHTHNRRVEFVIERGEP